MSLYRTTILASFPAGILAVFLLAGCNTSSKALTISATIPTNADQIPVTLNLTSGCVVDSLNGYLAASANQ